MGAQSRGSEPCSSEVWRGYHRNTSISHTKWEELACKFYIGSKSCFSKRFHLFHLPCCISPQFSIFSSWQRWFLSRNLLVWMWILCSSLQSSGEAPVVCSVWGWVMVLTTSLSSEIRITQIPTPEVSLKSTSPQTYLWVTRSLLCPLCDQSRTAVLYMAPQSCNYSLFCSASSQVLGITHVVSLTALYRASAPKPSAVPWQQSPLPPSSTQRRSWHFLPTDWLMANKTPKDFVALEKENEKRSTLRGQEIAFWQCLRQRDCIFASICNLGAWYFSPLTTSHSPGDQAPLAFAFPGNVVVCSDINRKHVFVPMKWNTYWWQLSRPRAGSPRSDSEQRHWLCTPLWAADLQ